MALSNFIDIQGNLINFPAYLDFIFLAILINRCRKNKSGKVSVAVIAITLSFLHMAKNFHTISMFPIEFMYPILLRQAIYIIIFVLLAIPVFLNENKNTVVANAKKSNKKSSNTTIYTRKLNTSGSNEIMSQASFDEQMNRLL